MERLHVDINLNQIKKNVGVVLAHISEHIQVIGVVKSGGYGHGSVTIAKILRESGIGYLAVSDLEEGLELRKKCSGIPILVLGEIGNLHLAEAISNDLTVTLSSMEAANRLSRIAEAMETKVRIHIKVDTGMGRFGMAPENVIEALTSFSSSPHLHLEGLFSHLSATFTDDEDSNKFTLQQLDIFENICKEAKRKRILPELVHIGSSTALIGFPDRVMSKPYTGIRIGTLFLGYEERQSSWRRHVQPVAEIHTDIHMIRELPPGHAVGYAKTFTTSQDTRLAILPIGYGHGFHRDFGNTGEVVINDQRAPIVGKPSLGQIIVDITQIPNAKIGDRVTLAGKKIPAFHEARKIGRGTWEVLLALLEHCEQNYF